MSFDRQELKLRASTNGIRREVIVPLDDLATIDLSQKFRLREDFYGTWAIGDAGPADTWSTTAGSGTGNQVATTVAASINGTVTLKSASDDGAHSANFSALTTINLG